MINNEKYDTIYLWLKLPIHIQKTLRDAYYPNEKDIHVSYINLNQIYWIMSDKVDNNKHQISSNK